MRSTSHLGLKSGLGHVLAACVTAPALVACKAAPPPPTAPLTPTAEANAQAVINAASPQPSAAAALGPEQAGGLGWTSVPPLVRRTPKSQMRAAEYGLANDPSAELTVFFFGAGQGGDIDQNIGRWLGQLTQADGGDTTKLAKRNEQQVGSIAVARVEVTGRYGGGMAMPGAPPPAAIDDAMLLGAIARGPQGSVFFKLIGSRSAVMSAKPSFDALIASFHAVQ